MAKKRFTPEQIIAKLRQVEILVSQGRTAVEAIRQIAVSEQTTCRLRKEYGGVEADQLKRLKALGQENCRLKGVVVEQALDIAVLKEASRPKLRVRPGGGRCWTTSAKSCGCRSVGHARSWGNREPRSATAPAWRTTNPA